MARNSLARGSVAPGRRGTRGGLLRETPRRIAGANRARRGPEPEPRREPRRTDAVPHRAASGGTRRSGAPNPGFPAHARADSERRRSRSASRGRLAQPAASGLASESRVHRAHAGRISQPVPAGAGDVLRRLLPGPAGLEVEPLSGRLRDPAGAAPADRHRLDSRRQHPRSAARHHGSQQVRLGRRIGMFDPPAAGTACRALPALRALVLHAVVRSLRAVHRAVAIRLRTPPATRPK